ncbi:hypothetical protein Tco_0275883 [Tanacetum coccineum]
MQAKILKQNSMNKIIALKTTTQHIERQTFTTCPLFQQAFAQLSSKDVRPFKFELSQNMQNLERQLNKETLHEKDSKSDLSVIKVQFDKFIHSEVLKPSNYNSYDREQDWEYQISEKQSNTSGNESSRSINECNDKSTSRDDTDIRPSYDTEPMVENDQNVESCDDERVTLANLIANLKLDIDENKNIQKQLKKANASLTQELKECKIYS